jgi:hypothetical protein
MTSIHPLCTLSPPLFAGGRLSLIANGDRGGGCE